MSLKMVAKMRKNGISNRLNTLHNTTFFHKRNYWIAPSPTRKNGVKNLELASPSLIQSNLDCCHQILVLTWDKEWISWVIPRIWTISSGDNNASSPKPSKDAKRALRESNFAGMLLQWAKCHSFKAALINFSFSFITKPPYPSTVKDFHLSDTNCL